MIRSETKDRVARIRFDRLDKKNAITVEMYAQLGAALAAAEADPQVRAVLLHGSPDCFTAGNDVADFLKAPRNAGSSPARALFDTLPQMKKPVVAAVGGPTIGIGRGERGAELRVHLHGNRVLLVQTVEANARYAICSFTFDQDGSP